MGSRRKVLYLTKFKAMAECSGLGNVIEPSVVLMTREAFAALADKTRDDCNLFMLNRKAGVLFMLGQESSCGLAIFQESVTMTNPHEISAMC